MLSHEEVQTRQPSTKAVDGKQNSIQIQPVKPNSIEVIAPPRPVKAQPSPQYSSPFNPLPLPGKLPGFDVVPQKSTPPVLATETGVQKPAGNKSSKIDAKKKPAPTLRQPSVNYNIYRDVSAYPIDPRKPNNPCSQTSNCRCGSCGIGKTGLYGQPYQPREPGGYNCGKRCSNKRPQFSVYWPRPLSAKFDERNPERAAARYSGCQSSKLVDVFDRLANFRLVDYQRTDNGYCGPGSDPYGCLGESKVSGLGYRVQSVPNNPANVYPLQ